MYLLLRVARRDRLHITLVGPSPSCLTARTLTRRVRPGLNRLQVGPAQVHGLKKGRYLVRIPVDDRPKPLLAAVTVVAGHRVAPGRHPGRLARACLPAPPTPAASSSPPVRTDAVTQASTPAPPAVHAHHGITPGSAPKALGNATRQAGLAAATAVKSTGHMALRHLLLLAIISFVLMGGWAVVFQLARFFQPPRHP